MEKFVSKPLSIFISEKIGEVSALIIEPPVCRVMLVLAHGAGAGMTHRFMETFAIALAERNVGTLRYNFPYMERGQRRPDPPAIAEKTAAMVIEKAYELYPTLPLLAGGKSFGGRMTSQRVSKECPEFVKGIVFVGFPLHPAGAPATIRADHLRSITIPMLFLQGTRDALADLALVEDVCAKLPSSTLMTFDGADHSFKAGKRELIPELAEAAVNWMNKKRNS